MKYLIREIPCCICCPCYDYIQSEEIHLCTELDQELNIGVYTYDPNCPLPKTKQEAADRK